MGYQAALHSNLGLHCQLHKFTSFTEGTVLFFESQLVLQPAFGSLPMRPHYPAHLPLTHPPHLPRPPPMESMRDTTGTEKTMVLLRCNFTLARSTLACVQDYLHEGSSQILRVK